MDLVRRNLKRVKKMKAVSGWEIEPYEWSSTSLSFFSINFTKLRTIDIPSFVIILSGWNWTPCNIIQTKIFRFTKSPYTSSFLVTTQHPKYRFYSLVFWHRICRFLSKKHKYFNLTSVSVLVLVEHVLDTC